MKSKQLHVCIENSFQFYFIFDQMKQKQLDGISNTNKLSSPLIELCLGMKFSTIVVLAM
jgi:hypothetical protein